MSEEIVNIVKDIRAREAAGECNLDHLELLLSLVDAVEAEAIEAGQLSKN